MKIKIENTYLEVLQSDINRIKADVKVKDSGSGEEKIRKACANALKRAGKLRKKSIAFPAMGCGVEGFSPVGSAKLMTQEVLKYVRENRTTLKRIVFCLKDKKTYSIFCKNAFRYVDHILNKLSKGPFVTADAIIEYKGGIVLIERSNPPYGLALPGGFVDYGESLERAVVREAKEETNLRLINPKQMHTYSNPGRDPRFYTVTTVFTAKGKGKLKSGDDAKGARVVKHRDLLKYDYAFDHKDVIRNYLRLKIKTSGKG